jgi:hypothetical protein
MARQRPSCARYHAPGKTYCSDCWPPRGRGRGESLYSPRRIRAKLRAQSAVRLHLKGLTYEDIARTLGYKDRSGAWRAIMRNLYNQKG